MAVQFEVHKTASGCQVNQIFMYVVNVIFRKIDKLTETVTSSKFFLFLSWSESLILFSFRLQS